MQDRKDLPQEPQISPQPEPEGTATPSTPQTEQPQGAVKPEEQRTQESSPSPEAKASPEIQQPHLVTTKTAEKRRLPFPPRSFIIAILTIIATIIIGFTVAQVLKGFLEGDDAQTGKSSTQETQERTTQPTAQPTRGSLPIDKETPNGSFEELLSPQTPESTTSSMPSEATEGGTVSQ
jgi:hypothetical protein